MKAELGRRQDSLRVTARTDRGVLESDDERGPWEASGHRLVARRNDGVRVFSVQTPDLPVAIDRMNEFRSC